VFTDKSGHVTVIDQAKRKVTVPGVKDAVFPAWSIDGGRVVWLQKLGRKKYRLMHAVLH
jgi:hypothetical protein